MFANILDWTVATCKAVQERDGPTLVNLGKTDMKKRPIKFKRINIKFTRKLQLNMQFNTINFDSSVLVYEICAKPASPNAPFPSFS